jgi:bifunctional non-homologous end joining protein LigD
MPTDQKLREYFKKRDFSITPEPRGQEAPEGGRSFVIQKHAASHLHYDFRLELEGVLKSWSVPKGPCFDPTVKRLAMATEDHPVAYGSFEGIIPKGEYGGGTVMLWDQGTWEPIGNPHEGYHGGNLKFVLHGTKLSGKWALVRIRGRERSDNQRSWLLIKERDELARPEADYNVTEAEPLSVTTGRSLDEIASEQDRVWRSNRNGQPGGEEPGNKAAAGGKAAARGKIFMPKGARKAALPGFVSPQLATLVSEAPDGGEWLHEMKFDGFRILARKDGDKVQLLTRTGQDWTARFAVVKEAVARLPVKRALIDGEVAVVMPTGITSFQALQNQLNEGESGNPLVYFVFDLLHLDGHDLTELPLIERKTALSALLGRKNAAGTLRYADHVDSDGPGFFAQACKAGLEGIISKRRDRPYVTRRSPDWVKTKCVKRQEFVIGGFTEPSGARQGLGALLVGFYEGDELRYAGKVGTGYTQKSAQELRKRLDKLVRKTSSFSPAVTPLPKGVHWVKPELLAEVGFTEMTADGKLRHPSFQGLREDKAAEDVVKEAPLPTKKLAAAPKATQAKATHATTPRNKSRDKAANKDETVAGVKLTHPERVLFPDIEFAKRDLAAYYEAVAVRLLPQIEDRPLALVRCPEGLAAACFYMKHAMKGTASTLRRVTIKESTKTGEYLVADSLASVIGIVQMSVLEIHTWNSKTAHLEVPDRVVFDFDPGPKVAFPEVVKAARALRERLTGIGFPSFVKSTGGKGLHVVVPLEPDEEHAGWDACFEFSRLVSESMVADNPTRYTTAMPKEGREAKILIDYFRNHRGSTSVAAYSTRARPGAPVSAPLFWDELDDFSPDRPFTAKTMVERLAGLRKDLGLTTKRTRGG